jgi:predicted amidophosphoribosyltransferase
VNGERMFAGKACIRCGYRLDGIESRRCPECGDPFDPADPLTFVVQIADPVVLVNTTAAAEAQSALAKIDAAGIPATIEHTAPGLIEPARSVVWVDRTDLDRAKSVMKSGATDRPPPWTCACGAEVDGDFELCWQCGKAR